LQIDEASVHVPAASFFSTTLRSGHLAIEARPSARSCPCA
jgi:hypothetical protein